MAQLSDSEPHDVKTISLGSAAPIKFATCSREFSTARFISRPSACADEGLPKTSAEIWLHRVQHFRGDASGGVVIEVNHAQSRVLSINIFTVLHKSSNETSTSHTR